MTNQGYWYQTLRKPNGLEAVKIDRCPGCKVELLGVSG